MRVLSAVVVLRRLSKMADYHTLAILAKLFQLLAFIFRRSSAVSGISRNRRLRAAARRRVRSYLQMRRRTNVTTLANIVRALCCPLPIERSCWNKARSENWWDGIVIARFTDEDWLKNFRMRKATFTFICEKLHPYLHRQDTNMRKALSVKKRVAVALWRLATGSYFNTIGHLFGISEASASCICDEVCAVVASKLLKIFVRLPAGPELSEVINDFEERWGFPQCAGAIDGSHIPIKAPLDYHADYYNRKGWYSVILQGLVDSKYRFRDINVGWPGKVHDARVFSNSSLYKKGTDGTLFPESQARNINGTAVPAFIIADAAYPLLPWVMKPFPDNGNLPSQKSHFNYRLSRARMVVENAFGCLKGRWSCLLKQNEAHFEKINNVVAACCTLHNIYETFHDDFDADLSENVDRSTQSVCAGETSLGNKTNRDAEAVRNAVVQYCQDSNT